MRSNDRGMVLAELAVVILISGIVTVLAARFVISLSTDASTATATAGRVDSVRLALDGLERQVRSGDAVYIEPPGGTCAVYGSGGNCVRVATEADGTTSCVQYQLIPDSTGDGSYRLRTRAYSPNWASGGAVGAWRQVANALAPPTTAAPPFSLAQQSGGGSQVLTVQFSAPAATQGSAPITLLATFTPRNALYGGSTACNGGAPA